MPHAFDVGFNFPLAFHDAVDNYPYISACSRPDRATQLIPVAVIGYLHRVAGTLVEDRAVTIAGADKQRHGSINCVRRSAFNTTAVPSLWIREGV